MAISTLHFTNVGPFSDIRFDFDTQVNVFVGPNNSGKSSLLTVLGELTVYPFDFPTKLLRESPLVAGFSVSTADDPPSSFAGILPILITTNPDKSEEYWNKARSEQYVEYLGVLGYSTFIPALRVNTDFRSRGPTPAREDSGPDFDDAYPELKRRSSLMSANASQVSDHEVIQRIIDLDYRFYLKKEEIFSSILSTISAIVSDITDRFPLSFSKINEDGYGFFPEFNTIDGPLSLNRLSQGTQSTIQWVSRLIISYAEYYNFTSDFETMPGVLIIDEIDAHLHPSWQRRIIPALTQHLPNLQIFCATHSPLMLAGLKAGQVHLLHREEGGSITVSTNTRDITAWSADEILRHLLDVQEPTDLQTSRNLLRLNELEMQQGHSEDELIERDELRERVTQYFTNSPASAEIRHFADTLFGQGRSATASDTEDDGVQD